MIWTTERQWPISRLIAGLTVICPLFVASLSAQEVLPRPDPKFDGIIGQTYKDSTPDKIPLVKAPAGAPNILLILIDDVGFGQWSTFGGQVPTPNLDGLAQERPELHALSHDGALLARRARRCSRDATTTRRGPASSPNSAAAIPATADRSPRATAMVPEILRQNGYSTAFFGKNHNIPDWETSISGPFDRWPGLQGFDHFYGFIGGEANQWQPALYATTTPVEMDVPKGREDELHAQRETWPTRRSTTFISRSRSRRIGPFFIYYAAGRDARAAPRAAVSGSTSSRASSTRAGTSTARRRFERQLKLGVIPPDTKLTPRPAEIPAWDSLTPRPEEVDARLMEVFAGLHARRPITRSAGADRLVERHRPVRQHAHHL